MERERQGFRFWRGCQRLRNQRAAQRTGLASGVLFFDIYRFCTPQTHLAPLGNQGIRDTWGRGTLHRYPRRLRNTEPWRGSGTVPHHVLSEHWISVGILDLGMAPGYERVRELSPSACEFCLSLRPRRVPSDLDLLDVSVVVAPAWSSGRSPHPCYRYPPLSRRQTPWPFDS